MLYGQNIASTLNESVNDELAGVDLKPFIELMAYDDLSRADADAIHEFCASPTAQVLQERQVLNKKTLMRLSKTDDEKRRIKLVAYQLARDDNDPNWKKMMKYRTLWKQYRSKVIHKYGARATKIARAAQREYIKNARKEPNKPVAR